MYEIGDYHTVGYCSTCEHKRLFGCDQPCDACVSIKPRGGQWRQAEPKEEVIVDA